MMNKDACFRESLSRAAHRLIPLTKGQVAIVDAADYARLARHKWHLAGCGGRYYAVRSVNGRKIRLHREILNVPAGMVCDHRNHNGLDNRKCNLRICTPSQNGQNRRPQRAGTSRYKGVSLERGRGKWRAVICHRGRAIHIGYYDYEVDAAIAYDDRAIELFGEFAYLNIQCRPEIKQWLGQMYLFPPTIYDGRGTTDDSGPPPQADPVAVASIAAEDNRGRQDSVYQRCGPHGQRRLASSLGK